MLEISMSGLMSGDGKRSEALLSTAIAPVLDSTEQQGTGRSWRPCCFANSSQPLVGALTVSLLACCLLSASANPWMGLVPKLFGNLQRLEIELLHQATSSPA